jgi:hypothetical protein
MLKLVFFENWALLGDRRLWIRRCGSLSDLGSMANFFKESVGKILEA